MLGHSKSNSQRRGFRHWVLASLQRLLRAHFLNLINFPIDERSLIVDMGCAVGRVTRSLSLRAETIGLDINMDDLLWAKKCNRHIDFVCCDICQLPLRQESVDIAVCKSVLEHIENLKEALKEIKFVLKNGGKLVAGYPIETRLLEVIFELFWSWESHVWSCHKATRDKNLLRDPRTHKQNFFDIRKMLKENFSLIKRVKILKNWFPDVISFYESVILVKNENEAKNAN